MVSENEAKPDKRIAIFEAMLDLIAERGFHGSPVSKMVVKAGVSVGSIYRYFKDKDELIHELFNYVAEKASTAILKGDDPTAPLRERFIRLCINSLNYMLENPKDFLFIEQYLSSPYGIYRNREAILGEGDFKRSKSPLSNLFETARSQQIIKDLPSPALHALTFGPISSLVRDIKIGFLRYDEEIVRKVVEGCWDAIRL